MWDYHNNHQKGTMVYTRYYRQTPSLTAYCAREQINFQLKRKLEKDVGSR